MIGFCNKINRDVLSEADCYFCKSVDLTCCRYWRDSKPVAVSEQLSEDIRSLIIASNNLIENNKKSGTWNLVCDEEIEFERALQKIRESYLNLINE